MYARALIPQSFRTLLGIRLFAQRVNISWAPPWWCFYTTFCDYTPAKQGKQRVPKKLELPQSLHRLTHIHAGTHRSGSQYSDNLDLYPALRFRQLKNSQRRWPLIVLRAETVHDIQNFFWLSQKMHLIHKRIPGFVLPHLGSERHRIKHEQSVVTDVFRFYQKPPLWADVLKYENIWLLIYSTCGWWLAVIYGRKKGCIVPALQLATLYHAGIFLFILPVSRSWGWSLLIKGSSGEQASNTGINSRKRASWHPDLCQQPLGNMCKSYITLWVVGKQHLHTGDEGTHSVSAALLKVNLTSHSESEASFSWRSAMFLPCESDSKNPAAAVPRQIVSAN